MKMLRKIVFQYSGVCCKRLKSTYVHKTGNEPLKYITLGKLIEEKVKIYGDNEYIIHLEQNKRITYKKIFDEANILCANFIKIGLKKGDRVGVWLPNLYVWPVIKYACARAGYILVALNPAYQALEIEYAINKVGIKCLVCPDKIKNQDYYEILNLLIPNLDKHEPKKIKSNKIPSLESIVTVSKETFKGTLNYHELLNSPCKETIENISKNQQYISPDDPFAIMFSSGTTGKPKAAVQTHFGLLNNSYLTGKRHNIGDKHHKILMMQPYFHALGFTICNLMAMHFGTTVVMPTIVYSPKKNLDALKKEKCTILHGTPTMHIDLINEVLKSNHKLYQIDMALSGGAPISPHTFKQMQTILNVNEVKSVYGLTETTAVIFESMPGDDEQKSLETVGYIMDHVEAKVVDANENMVPFGCSGELMVRGYMNITGYWDDPKKTDELIGDDGWLKTGDQFIIDESGYGKIVGRNKDMIIRGGENIFPKEVEDFLVTHPDILDVQVIGLPHERLSEEVCACVRLNESTKTISLEDIKTFCKGKIAQFKIPSKLFVVDTFPKTLSGKIQKYKLVEMFSK